MLGKDMSNIVMGFSIGLTLIGSLSIIAVLWCKLAFMRFGLVSVWISQSVLTILGFLAAANSYSVAVALMENCGGIAKLANDATAFNSLIGFIELPQLKTCFFGDGDLLAWTAADLTLSAVEEVASDMSHVSGNSTTFEEDVALRYINTYESLLSSYVTFQSEGVS